MRGQRCTARNTLLPETIMKLVHPIALVVAMAGLLVVASATQGQPPDETTVERFMTARPVSTR